MSGNGFSDAIKESRAFPRNEKPRASPEKWYIDAALLQLPGREPGALQERPGLVGEDVKRAALLSRREEDGQRRAVIRRSQAARVAVGQHALPVGDQARADAADFAAHLAVFFRDGQRFLEKQTRQLRRGALFDERPHGFFESIERPEEVHGRRPARAEIVGHLLELGRVGAAVAPDKLLHAEDDAHGGGDADGGSATNAQRPNRLPDLFDGAAIAVDDLRWQLRLIDEPDMAVGAADPGDGTWRIHGLVTKPARESSSVRGKASDVATPHARRLACGLEGLSIQYA